MRELKRARETFAESDAETDKKTDTEGGCWISSLLQPVCGRLLTFLKKMLWFHLTE